MKKIFLIFTVLTMLIQCSCGSLEPITRTAYALGTFISVKAYGSNSENALNKAFERLYEIELIASSKLSESELSYVNANAFSEDIIVSEELFYLLKTGLYYSRLTDGAFDITLGALIDLWGIGTENARVPEPHELNKALQDCGYKYLSLNDEEYSVRFLARGLKLDLGGIAKGYAADEMKRILLENGIKKAVLNLGGNILFIGTNDGADWRVGLTDPLEPSKSCARMSVGETAVVTSGNYERFFTYEGVNYWHIFDSETGFPADCKIISATIITESSMVADILSTAFFVKGESFSKSFPDLNYVLIDKDMNFTFSENLNIEILK